MADKMFVMDLAKLVIAAAWADGSLQNQEINSLKDLIFRLGDIGQKEWNELEIYMDSPVGSKETEQLVGQVLGHIKSEADKDFVIATLKKLVEADGVITEDEEKLLEGIKSAVLEVDTGIGGRLSKMLKAALNRRSETYKLSAGRQADIDDFINNTIYYQYKRDCREKGIEIELSEEKVSQLCLAAGLLARVAWVDEDISNEEKQTINQVLCRSWGLAQEEAEFVTRISCYRAVKGLDYFRLTRSFFERTTLQERRSFLVCLFKVANASERCSHEEVEEIRSISEALKLTHKDFIAAKITISDEDLGIT